MRERTVIATGTVIDVCPACGTRGKQLQRIDTDERGTHERRLCYVTGCGCRWSVLPSGT